MSLSPSRHRRRSFQADERIGPIPKPSSVWRPANLDKERSTISWSKRLASQSAHRRSVDSETSVRSTTSSRKMVSPRLKSSRLGMPLPASEVCSYQDLALHPKRIGRRCTVKKRWKGLDHPP